MNLTPELLKDIKQRADIATVIGNYIEVQKRGRSYRAVCPFHDDHDPSLHIDVQRQTFMCYVCKTGGDVFTFVEKFKKISFIEAVLEVARLINYDDPRLHESISFKKTDESITPLYNCINELQKYYEYALSTAEGEIAANYLANRHITQEQIDKFGLGYALKDGKITIQYLKNKGISIKTIEEIGIAYMNGGNMSDNNAGRLIFPIKDASGQVLGFSARKLISGGDDPKYVNSPETKIFHKGFILYNLNNAKSSCKHDGYLYITEGFMDVFALDSIGYPSVVALMGTKLTTDHIRILKNLNVEIRLCLDGDAAGQKGMMAIMPMLNEANIPYRVVSLPGELRDPDEILKQDGEQALKKFINTLVDPFTFALNYYENIAPLDSVDNRKKVVRHFVPILKSTKDELLYKNYLTKLAKVTGFEQSVIQDLVNKYHPQEDTGSDYDGYLDDFSPKTMDEAKDRVSVELRKLYSIEKAVMLQMLNYEQAVLYFDQKNMHFTDVDFHKLAMYLVEYMAEHGTLDVSDIMNIISLADEDDKSKIQATLTELLMERNVPPYTETAMNEYLAELNKERAEVNAQQELKQKIEGKAQEERISTLNDFLKSKTKKQLAIKDEPNKTNK